MSNVRALVKIFELDNGTKQYQPCLMLCADGAAPSAGELFFDEFILFDTEEEATNKSAEMLEDLLKVLDQVAEKIEEKDGDS